jgi:hypothetical protein
MERHKLEYDHSCFFVPVNMNRNPSQILPKTSAFLSLFMGSKNQDRVIVCRLGRS